MFYKAASLYTLPALEQHKNPNLCSCSSMQGLQSACAREYEMHNTDEKKHDILPIQDRNN